MPLTIRDGTPDDAVGLAPAFAALGYPVEPSTLRGRLSAMLADGRIELTSGDNHAAAHSFYRHLGYADNGIRFAKPLGG